MSTIHFQATYHLSHQYESIKSRAPEILGDFYADASIYRFNDDEKALTFTSERLISSIASDRKRVLLLFSNPHPHSIQQGMFLSPSVKGRESFFWTGMKDAGWFRLPEESPTPNRLADIFLKLDYESPFELLFYCYYSFPTRYPDGIVKLFGKDYLKVVIEPEAREGYLKIIQQKSPSAIITFNMDVFNSVAKNKVIKYTDQLKEGKIILSLIKDIEINIPVYLSYPTGWHFFSNMRKYRKESLENIKENIETSFLV